MELFSGFVQEECGDEELHALVERAKEWVGCLVCEKLMGQQTRPEHVTYGIVESVDECGFAQIVVGYNQFTREPRYHSIHVRLFGKMVFLVTV
jgi:hypothetical protein